MSGEAQGDRPAGVPRGEDEPSFAWVLPAVGVVLALALGAGVGHWRIAGALSADLPVRPDLTEQTAATVHQVEQVEAAARSRPTIEAIIELGAVYHANTFLAEAVRCYELAMSRDPGDWRSRYLRARALADMGDVDAAAEGFAATVERNPTLAIGWHRLGEARFKLAQYDASLEAYRRAAQVLPDLPAGEALAASGRPPETMPLAAYAKLGEALSLLRLGRVEASKRIAQAMADEYTTFGPAFALLEEIHRLEGRNEEADRCYRLAWGAVAFLPPPDPIEGTLRQISTSSTYLLYAADVAKRAGDADEALRCAARAAEVNPRHHETLVNAAKHFLELGEPEEAARLFERALAVRSDDVESQAGLAMALIGAGQRDRGLAKIRICVEKNPDSATAYYNYGAALLQLGEHAAAAAALQRSIALRFTNINLSYRLLGAALRADRRAKEAETALREGLKLQENDWPLRIELAGALIDLGRRPEAIEQLRAAAQYTPNDPRVVRLLVSTLLTDKQVEAAEAEARRVPAAMPRSSDAHVFYASVAVELKRRRAAVYHAQIAAQLAPDSNRARQVLAEALRLPEGVEDAVGGVRATAAATQPATPQRGQQLYRNWCAACHSVDDRRALGPSFRGLFGNRREFADGTTAVADEGYLRESIRRPAARVVKGYPAVMAPVALREDEIESLVAYIKTLAD